MSAAPLLVAPTSRAPVPPLAVPDRRIHILIAWCVWIGFTIIFTLITARRTMVGQNTVVDSYRDASLRWLAGKPLYELDSVHGFLYLPSAAVLGTPFALLNPAYVHEFAWRWVSIAILALSARRLAKALLPSFRADNFLQFTLLILPVCIGSARAGQMNLMLAATMVFAAAEAIQSRWWLAAFWLALGFALKPQAIVLAALLIALYPQLRIRGTLAILIALAFPFLCQDPTYVLHQYQACFQKLSMAGRPSDAGVKNSDIFGLLGPIGEGIPEKIRWLLRLAAAAAAFLASWYAVRRKDRVHGIMATLALAACYLMLFNPRTEGGSYIIAAAPLAVYAVWEWDRSHHPLRAMALALIALGWTVSYELSRLLWYIAFSMGLISGKSTDFREGYGPYWLSPALSLILIAFLIHILKSYTGPADSSPSKNEHQPAKIPAYTVE